MTDYETHLAGLFRIEPRVFGDQRGFFLETFQQRRFEAAGLSGNFIQDNQSRSQRGTLRGLHFQLPRTQAKLVFVIRGEIWDVAVDVRKSSPTFGQWYGVTLSETNHWQLYIPEGFAHGFCVVSETADVVYKCTDYYAPDCEKSLKWDDPDLAIPWPVTDPLLSAKDQQGKRLAELECCP
ncbi:MAG: dTDP-4-dehydrorhamnose 3,5-epimerase [Planctomycetaceae bacterium]|nr:dTDP-4-dehydrorhamnose 3,5-epimerase [Planctomycetaceae bacterium]